MQRLRDQQTRLLEKMARPKDSVRSLLQGRPRLRSVPSSSPRMNSLLPSPTLLDAICVRDRGLLKPKKTGRQAFGHRHHRLATWRAMKTWSRGEGKL
jgi:hypothetical protein